MFKKKRTFIVIMKITILIDNRIQETKNELATEHGFSALIEFVEIGQNNTLSPLTILLDTGASEKFALNAALIGKDLKAIDFAVLSHGHTDHTGGLSTFLEGSTAPIYLSDKIAKCQMFSLRGGKRHNIGTEHSLITQNPHRFHTINSSHWIKENIALIKCTTETHPRPYGNNFQRIVTDGTEHSDTYAHELALAIVTPEGLVILSPCSHSGVGNIIESAMNFCKTQSLKAFIGGFHIVESEHSESEARYFTENIAKRYPTTQFFTGHCTCSKALAELGGNITLFSTGYTIEI